MKPNKHTRKTRCPDCGVAGGSRHNPRCPWAYAKQADHKTRETITVKQKISAIIKIIKA